MANFKNLKTPVGSVVVEGDWVIALGEVNTAARTTVWLANGTPFDVEGALDAVAKKLDINVPYSAEEQARLDRAKVEGLAR